MPDKKYLIEIPDMPEGSGIWEADKWERNKEAFMKENPTAKVFEMDAYNADDADENDQILISMDEEESSGLWDSDKWERNKEAFIQENPDAQISRVRFIDYWGDRAAAIENRLAELDQPDQERAARLAEIGYFDDNENIANLDVNLKPVSQAMKVNSVSGDVEYLDPAVEEFFANDDAYTQKQLEKNQLKAEYDTNPTVIAQREWEAKRKEAEKAYRGELKQQITEDYEANVDKNKAARGGIEIDGVPVYGPASFEAEKQDKYLAALQLLNFADRMEKGEKFWEGVGYGITKAAVDYDGKEMQQVGLVFKKLEDRGVNINEATEEQIDEALDPEDKALMSAYLEYEKAMYEADPSRAFKGGAQFGETIPFIMEFVATGNIYKAGAKKTMELAGKKAIGKGFAKWIAKSAGKKIPTLMKQGVAKATTGTIKALGGTLARTIAEPTTYKKMGAPDIQISEKGDISVETHAVREFFDQYTENLSEISGEGMVAGLGGAAKLLKSTKIGKMPFMKLGEWLGNKAVWQGLSKLGAQSLPIEVAEEVVGNALRYITGVDKEALSRMFEKDEFASMVIGFAPLTVLGMGTSAAAMGAVNIGAATAANKMRNVLSTFYTEEQIDAVTGSLERAKTSDDIVAALKPILVGMHDATQEEKTAVMDYAIKVAKKKAMISARNFQEMQLSDAAIRQVEDKVGRFWIENEDKSRTVRQVDLNDGRQVFVVSQPNEAGEVAIVEVETGKKGAAKLSDIKQEIFNSSLESYGTRFVMADRKAKEQERMANERQVQINLVRQNLDAQNGHINLGTESAPVVVIADAATDAGVRYVAQNGSTGTLTWEAVADAMGTPIIVKTDAQLAQEEAAAIVARDAERRASQAKQDAVGTEEVVEAAEEVQNAANQLDNVHIPMNEDGTVNETAFWEQNPEAYVQWNDEQQQDGGVDSLEQIINAKNGLTALLTEAQTAQQTSDPVQRKAAKAEVQRLTEKIGILTALEQRYAEALKTPEQKKKDVEENIKTRVKEWSNKTGVEINVVEDLSQVKNTEARAAMAAGQKVFAWAESGKAYMYLPAIESVEQLDEKFAHEVVAHIGLRSFLGDGYDALLDRVWNSMSDTAKRRYANYGTVRGDQRSAADEYLAYIAEKMGSGVASVQEFNEEEKTVWQSIVDFVKEAFNKIFGNSATISEEEIADLIRASYRNLEKQTTATDEATEKQRAAINNLMGALTPEEAVEVAENDYQIASDALKELQANQPKVEKGESSASYIERKKAYNENLRQAQAKADAARTIADEVKKMTAPAPAQVSEVQPEAEQAPAVEVIADQVDSNEPRIIKNVDGAAVAETDGNGSTMLSVSSYEDGGREYLVNWLANEQYMGQDEKDFIIATLDQQYELAKQLGKEFPVFGAWSSAEVEVDGNGNPIMSVIKANGDYSMNLDFSLICKKRRPLNALLDIMIADRMLDMRSLDEGEIAKINKVIQRYGFEVACALCFVDSKRYRVVKVANDFADIYNNLVNSLIPAGSGIEATEYNYAGYDYINERNKARTGMHLDEVSASELDWTKVDEVLNGVKTAKTVEQKIARMLKNDPQSRRLVNATDFVTNLGFESVKKNNPELLKLYNAKKGTGGPKASFGDVQYLNDILKNKSFTPAKAYAVGGVRIQSFSDYMGHMFFDYMQMMAELAAKNLPAHAYTKEEAFARIFGMTGVKINLSLVPAVAKDGIAPGLDAEGNYVWAVPYTDESGNEIQGQTFPPEVAFEMQRDPRYSGNVGAIAVGISDEHILKMLDDENIHFIIPYHKSSLSPIVAKETNIDQFKDYTNSQNTKLVSNEENDALSPKQKAAILKKNSFDFYESLARTEDPKATAQEYLEHCKKHGFVPKFNQFSEHDNYYKLLVDFNTYDFVTGEYAPQGPVKMTFPEELEQLVKASVASNEELETDLKDKVGRMAQSVKEELGRTMFSVEPRTEEQREQLFAAAKKEFGTTNNFNVAGFMLPDGSLLDFSEEGAPANQRTLDHREIEGIIMDEGREYDNRWQYLADFMNEGAIRLLPEYAGINLMHAPTAEQRKRLFDFIYKYNGEVILEIADDRLNNVAYVEYDRRTSPSRIFRDIDGYFKEGIVPQQNTMFSVEDAKNTVEGMFAEAISGKFTGKPKTIGVLTEEGKAYLESISGIEFKGRVTFVLNPSDLNHVYKEHFGENEKDTGSNIPLNIDDIRNIVDVVSNPERVLYLGDDNGKRFAFLAPAVDGAYNLVEVYTTKRGNLSSKTFYKTKKGVSHRAMILEKESGHSTSETNGAALSATNVPKLFDIAISEEDFNRFVTIPEQDAEYLAAVEAGDMEKAQQMVLEAAKRAMPNTKVVDENGEPRVVYHGSPNAFTAFDKDMIGETTDPGFYGQGFYFATTKAEAKGYGKHIIDAFVSLENPLDLNTVYEQSKKWDGETADGAVRWWYGLASMFPEQVGDVTYASIERGDWTILELKNRIDELAESSETPFADAMEEFEIDDSFFDWLEESDINIPEEFTSALVANGYDGVINAGAENNEIVALNPSQIKSADPVTYDDAGNVIPLSERFNPASSDIRFSLQEEGQSSEDFHNAVLNDFKKQFNVIAPTTVVRVEDRSALAEAIGVTAEDLTDDMYQRFVDGVNRGGAAFYADKTDRIVIFALDRQTRSAEIDDNIFHENTHAMIDKHPELLELGQWLWDNADRGMRRTIKEDILSKNYPESQHANEMLSKFTGNILAMGRAGEVLNILPADQKKHWEFILNAFGYEPEREDRRRLRGFDLDAARAGVSAAQSQQTVSDNGASARYSAEERRVINELFPGAIQEETRFSAEEAASEDYTRFSVVTDPALIEELENGPKIKVYRAMQLIDGELYPPMSAKVEGKLREPIKLGQWEQAEERPDLIDSKGNFKLDKANKASVPARYNPYFHTSRTPLNDQFSSAQSRPNLVTVEVEIPESELTSGYKADKAKDSVGEKEWKAGVIQGKLSGTRKVILSRWDKPVRIVPDSEVAAEIVKMFEGKDITMPSNVVTPSLRAELEKLGVPFVETDNNGKLVQNAESNTRFSLDTETEIKAIKGLSILDSMNISLEQEMVITREAIDAERKRITELNKRLGDKDLPVLKKQIENAEDRLKTYLRQMEILQDVEDKLIKVELVEPDVRAQMANLEPQNAFEYLSELLTMHLTPIVQTKVVDADGKETIVRQGGKKKGVMLTPETLEKELGYSKSDWKGISYIVSESEGMSLDAIAEMIEQDFDASHIFGSMNTMEIKDVIIDFLQSMSSYTEIRDYIKNERERMAKEEADEINGRIQQAIEEIDSQFGMSIDEYNAMLIQEERGARERWLEENENPERFAKFEQSNIEDNGQTSGKAGEASEAAPGANGEGSEGGQASEGSGNVAGSGKNVENPADGGQEAGAGNNQGNGNGGENNTGDQGGNTATGVVPDNVESGKQSVDEIVESGKQKVLQQNADAADTLMDRIRAINGNLQQLRMMAAAQREYDKQTVKAITDLANELLTDGALSDMTRGEIKRLLSVIKDATGKSDLTISVDRLMDIMIGNQLRYGRNRFEEYLKIRGKKVDARGVEVRGKLDVEGQQIMDAVREGISLDLDRIQDRISAAEDKLFDSSQTISRNAEHELAGLEIAKQYVENIKESESEEKDLRKELKDAKDQYDAGVMEKTAYKEFVKATHDAIRENRMQRVIAYENLLSDMADMVKNSILKAGQLREAEKARVERIQHFANSDMQGMPADEHQAKTNKFWNNPIVRFLLKPLATFDQMLRHFAPKSRSGEGYLWNHFMGGWLKATENEYKGIQAAHEKLDAKVRSVFGDKVKRWSDLFAIEKKMPKATISFWDAGEIKEFEVTQGNLLYIYMVNKMTDGKMKLRKMGISEEDVISMARELDPRFLELADWLQEEFLPGLREKYNAVHERLFGAPMAAIDNYFPIRVLANARSREVDINIEESNAKPSTITGNIMKRTKNSLALDILGSDAFDVILGHINDMERWAAFAEWNKDLNTLLSYKKFRNRVQNMSGIYGAGTVVWNNFRSTAEIAAGVYKPATKADSVDKTIMNIAKGVTGAKISFRVYTAFKQLLSWPAFISDTNPVILAKNMANPFKAWNWAMENLPLFEKRWKSRQAGDSRLMQTESDWKLWKTKVVEIAGRLGMTPNALVDAVTVAIGARSVYESRLKQYLDYGYDQAKAEDKARRDATVAFNESQQSNESAFLSQIQMDRTVASVVLTVFRNSSMGYQRMYVDALRNITNMTKKGYKTESVEFMKKQMMRDGLSEADAERAANRIYSRSFVKNAVQALTFGFIVQLAWNLGPYLPYIFAGDDDEQKKEMAKDAAVRAFVGGPVEGMSGGPVLSNIFGNVALGEKLSEVNGVQLPLSSDVENLFKLFGKDNVRAVNEIFNIVVQSGIGVNPQTITDAVVAIVDACNGDLSTASEAALCMMRILQVPQSQIENLYLDEIDFTADEALDLTIREFAERYAKYKVLRSAPLTKWMYADEKEKEREETYIKKFISEAEDLKRTRGNEEAKAFYQYYDNEYADVAESLRDLKRRAYDAEGDEVKAISQEADELVKTEEYKRYDDLISDIKSYEAYKKLLKDVTDPETRKEYEKEMLKHRRNVVNKINGYE